MSSKLFLTSDLSMRAPAPKLALHSVVASFVLAACSALPLAASVTIVPVPVKPNVSAPYTVSGAYSVRVEDSANSGIFQNVDTHVHKVSYPDPGGSTNVLRTNAYYTHFSFGGGTAKVKITLSSFAANAPSGTFSVKLSPTSYGISTSISGNVVSFNLSSSRYLMMKITDANNTYLYYLMVIADALETNVPPSSGTGIYNIVTQYGAAGDYSTDAKAAIQSAVDAAQGGGIVYVPPGVYKIGNKILARSNVSVYLAPGAYIRTADDLDRSVVGTKIYIFDAPSGSNITNFKIYGRGTLDCNGVAAGGHRHAKMPFADADNIQDLGVLSMGLRADNGSNITLDGVVLRESCGWMVHPDRSSNVVFTNTKVVNYTQDFGHYREDDGLDLVQCQDSKVTHCLVFSADDAVCMKGSDGFDTLFEGVDNCIYYDLVLFSGADGCKFGMQAQSGITNSFFKNIDIVQASRAIAIHVTSGSSTFNHIGFTDVRCEKATSRPIDFELLTSGVTAHVTNASIVNFTSANAGASLSTIKGQSAATFNGVAFTNLNINSTPVTSANAATFISTNSYALNVTYAQGAADSNLVLDVSPTGMSTNWKTTGNTLALVNDGLTTNEGQTSNSADAQVTYPVPNMLLASARVYKDNATYGAASWKLERQDVVSGAWITVFDFTSCPTDGWNSGPAFSPTLASAVRLTFRPVAGAFIGINEVEVYGR